MARAKGRKASAKAGRKKVVKGATARRVAAEPKGAAGKPKAAAKAAGKARAAARKASDSATAMRALAQRIVDATLRDDDEAILGLYAADVESSEAGNPPDVGIEALRAKYVGWRNMTSATAFEPRNVVVDGNVIVIEWLGRVTLAASGRQVEMREVAIHEIRDGKIVREAFYYNPAVLAG
jgi:ketosteroid isomerase-like protein